MAWRSCILLSIIAMVALGDCALAAKTIFKCVHDGQVILADHPCETTPSDDSGHAAADASAADAAVGTWRGQIQYQLKDNGSELASAHSVASLTLELMADGNASGSSSSNGCTLLGTWSRGSGPRVIALDVTLSECRDAAANRRYVGALILSATDSSADVSLVAGAEAQTSGSARSYTVKGTLRH